MEAGLFSAVLSAFIVVAFPALQPDRAGMLLYSVDRIAIQTAGYTFDGTAFISSQISPPPPPPFQPAVNDIRVNVLWFTSLVISLVVASISMLVKQWLREFLAVEVPSPQARLRLRHFREPHIRGWKVYEIAATLPLLLQLSLGLFFVGLCLFTAAIHRSIGYATLPLVIGWAIFFFTATIAPILFPLCPYKTVLLKAPATRLQRMMLKVTKQLHLYAAHAVVAHLPRFRYLSNIYRRVVYPLEIPDELALVADASHDMDILVSVDAIQADDDLLITTVAEALHYINPRWQDVVAFLLQILSHRVPTLAQSERTLPNWPLSTIFPLCSIRPQTKRGLLEILANHADEIRGSYQKILPLDGPVWDDSSADSAMTLCAFAIILSSGSPFLQQLPTPLNSFLLFYLSDSHYGPLLCSDYMRMLCAHTSTSEWIQSTGSRLSGVMDFIVSMTQLIGAIGLDYISGKYWFEGIQLNVEEYLLPLESQPPIKFNWRTWNFPARLPRNISSIPGQPCFIKFTPHKGPPSRKQPRIRSTT